VGKKKDKKSIAKRSAKAQERKKQKRKLRLVKTNAQEHAAPLYFDQPSISEIEAPPGFRAVSVSQALMEYSKSIVKWDESASMDAMNKAFQFSTLLWNFALAEEDGAVDQQIKNEILKMIKDIYEVDADGARALLENFVSRKDELFPPDVQIKGSRYFYMRKDVTCLIAPFNYDRIELNDEVFPADDADQDFLDQLNELDQDILSGRDYEEWEEKYLTMEESCEKSFSRWLKNKGAEDEFVQTFPFLSTMFINFIYRYAHDGFGILSKVRPDYFEEFLFDYVLRKVLLEPHQHIEWPPALKLFFRFLSEKGYLEDADRHIEVIDVLESQFIDVLKERYN